MNINIQSNEGSLVWFWQHGGGFMEKIFSVQNGQSADPEEEN